MESDAVGLSREADTIGAMDVTTMRGGIAGPELSRRSRNKEARQKYEVLGDISWLTSSVSCTTARVAVVRDTRRGK